MSRRLLGSDDKGVEEVIGFIMTFAISAVILVIAITAYNSTKGSAQQTVDTAELTDIANRVASRIVEAGLVSQSFPNANFNVTVDIPQDVSGRPYYVQANAANVWVNTTDGASSVRSTTYKTDAIGGIVVANGKVYSTGQAVSVQYSLAGAQKKITLKEP